MTNLLIVYHSGTGNTEAMAKAVYEGVVSTGATVSLKKAVDTTSNDLLDCDAVIFGTPNNFDYMAGAIKDFFDRTFYKVLKKVNDKPYAAFGSAGDGEKQALDSIDKVCSYFKLRKAFDDVVANGKPSPEVLEECKELGRKLAQL